MSRGLTLLARASALALIVATASGCVDRHFVIESDPPGANVFLNGKLVGATPMNHSFTYSGNYRFVFVRDGYEWATFDECVRSPWYLWFPFEFISENLIPWNIRDEHFVGKTLAPRQDVPADAIRQRAEQLRSEGQAIVGPPIVIPP